MTEERALISRPSQPAPLPAFAPTAFSDREREVLEAYRESPRSMRTKVKRADDRPALAVHGWAATQALDELFAHRWWVTTQEVVQGDDIVVKVTLMAMTDDGGALVRQAYGGRSIKGRGKAFILGGSVLADALKAAEADGLKKICAQLGMFQDVYRQGDTREEAYSQTQAARRSPSPRAPGRPAPVPIDSARNARSDPRRQQDPEDAARAALFAAANAASLETEVKLRTFLRTESIRQLADHMKEPAQLCKEPDCPRPHGLGTRAQAYRVMKQWLESAPKKEEEQ